MKPRKSAILENSEAGILGSCAVCETIGSDHESCTHQGVSPYSIVENRSILERELIRRVVRKKRGNMTQAAATLEISLKTLYAKVHEYRLEEDVVAQRTPRPME